jgi:hypothetical protein
MVTAIELAEFLWEEKAGEGLDRINKIYRIRGRILTGGT